MSTTEQEQDFTLRANAQHRAADGTKAAAVSVESEAAFAARFVAAVEGFRLATAALV